MYEKPINAEQQLANAFERIAVEMTVLRNSLQLKAENEHTHTCAEITDLESLYAKLSELSKYALINSPNFEGTPSAPTPDSSDNSKRIATTAFVKTALSEFSSAGGGFAKLTGASFTGTVSFPTPAQSSNDTTGATTAWVTTKLSGSLADYVTTSALNSKLGDYVTSSGLTTKLGAYVTTATFNSTLKNYVTTSSLSTTLQGYVTTSGLTSTLQSYVTSTSLTQTLASYAKTADLSAYAKLAGATFTGAVAFNAGVDLKGATTCVTPTAGTHVANKQYVDQKIGNLSSIPTGTIVPFAGTSVPSGFLICNGAAVSRTDYANLFAVIGTKYGSGNGSTTFNVPNLNERFIQYTTTTSSVGQTRSAGLPDISGINNPYGIEATHGYTVLSGAFSTTSSTTAYAGYGHTGGPNQNVIKFSASRSSSTYGSSSSVQPPALRLLPCIKA